MNYLLAAVPDWFEVTGTTATEILGSTSLSIENAVGVINADLRVHETAGVVYVQEQVPGTRFPRTCHERHLQSDEHFCIGLNAGDGISSSDHAVVWWGLLQHFLELQRVAERTRRWPPKQEMAHGDAGPHQRAAMNAATELGIYDEYMRMLEGEKTWFGDASLKVNTRGKLSHGWMPCPVGCRKNGNPIPRSSCSRQAAVIRLITEEKLRREKVARFNITARAWGEKCCRTMLNCPLADNPRSNSIPNTP
ncbi:E2 domain-containing protein [Agrobacterium rosae]|uniref:E2 domain-containing protein n=1 Tax=Agrobacterium rosae TaxID=1972867 RepID=UPI002A15926A|nr:E2 domain-containing protein [Agrobacterium rosae]MDX8313952.1 hypothetical protein [Agrobacterium rosae]